MQHSPNCLRLAIPIWLPELHFNAARVACGRYAFPCALLLSFLAPTMTQAAEPSKLTAVAGNGIVSLVWMRPDTLKTETYRIYRSTTPGNTGTTAYRTIAQLPRIPTIDSQPTEDAASSFFMSYGDTNVTNGTKYYYQVSLVRGGTESVRTTEVNATPVSASHAITKSRFLKIMPMGNSITGGWCGDCGSCSKQYGGYRGLLYDTLVSAGYNYMFVGNCTDLSLDKPWQFHEGWGNRRVQDLQRTVARRALTDWDPDLVLLQIGTNNFAWGGSSVQEATRAYDSLLSIILTLKPDLRLLMAPILPLPRAMTSVNSFNAAIKKKADSLSALGKKVTWVTEMEEIDQSKIAPDNVHPYCSAYPLIASKWFRAIKRVTDQASIELARPERGVHFDDAARDKPTAPAHVFTLRGARVPLSPDHTVRLNSTGVYVVAAREHGVSHLRKVMANR